jgi:N-acetylmuramic acid 6-phosphate etherase
MKAALAQKMMLTMLSTAVMVRTGKVYGNLMVDVAPTSQKLRERAKGLVMDVAGVDYAAAAELLTRSRDDVKVAIVVGRLDVSVDEARRRLQDAHGRLAKVLGEAAAEGEETP